MSVRVKTATTEHLISITVSRDGDEGVEPDYLESIILDGLGHHNAKVRRHGTQDGDYVIDVLGLLVSDNFTGRDLAMVLEDGDTHSGLPGCAIREFDDNDEIVNQPNLFEF